MVPPTVSSISDAQTEPCPACGSLLDVTDAQIFAERTCPVCATPINVRRKFGHYELMSVVGSGGQGVVYRAVDNNLNRLVALKLLRTEYSEDPDFVRQFEHEARLTASINHPNVVRVYSFGADEGHVYLAMELVDNGTMDDLLEKLGRIPEARALQIGIEIAQGLRAGYEKGLIHRDVKPGNVLFAQDGTAKVVDYGLAMFFEQAALASGEIWGTPYYLSPERLNKSPEDFRSDIYSLGAALFHAIAGRPPFEAEDASHVALKHLRAQAVSLQTFAPGVCNATTYVINRTLQKNPDDRQQSYDEFIEQLQFAREEALAKARGGGQQQQSRLVLEDAKAKKTASWITLATLIIFAIGLLVGVLLILKGAKGENETPVVPSGTASADLGSFGPGWAEARELLLKGDYREAAKAFLDLASKHEKGTTERSLAYVHQALALMFAGEQSKAVEALEPLAQAGTVVSKFFTDEVAPRLQGEAKVPAEATRNYNARNYQALAALFFALKNYEHNHFEDAGSLLRQFAGFTADASSAWISDYKKLSRPLQDQLDSYVLAVNAWNSARTAKEREDAFNRVREMARALPLNSKLQTKARDLLLDAEKRNAAEMEARIKANFALRSPVQASGYDVEKGDIADRAVDGDLKTRWAHKKQGEKWLSVDLNSTKQIGRWVIKTAGAGGEKAELNITEASLQKSDDGKNWTTVDTFTGNRKDIIDRIIRPVSARYARIISTKGGVKAGDNGFRVIELELTAADEQAKAEYAPNQSVAMKFSPASDFQFGPIGEPNALGSAKYDEKSGKYTIKGSGADIWTHNDHFHFAWQPIDGDCELIARVTSVQRQHDWTKAGVMIRSDLTKDASFGMMAAGASSKAQFARRPEPNKPADAPLLENVPLPLWIKVQRKGSEVIGFYSKDGKSWTEHARVTPQGLGTTAYVGLAVCSHVSGQLSEAQFDNVLILK